MKPTSLAVASVVSLYMLVATFPTYAHHAFAVEFDATPAP
jgi:hypothetical protein